MIGYNEVFSKNKSVLFVMAHPDDADVMFGGLIARLCSDSKKVSLLLTTTGARGSKNSSKSEIELAQERLTEEKEAMKILGVYPQDIYTLGYKDGEVEQNFEMIEKISFHIRKIKPDIVFTHEAEVYYVNKEESIGYVMHRDHRNTGISTMDAVYPFSRDRSFFPEHYEQNVEPHEVFDIVFTPEKSQNCRFDITDFADKKRAALKMHKSQFDDSIVELIMGEDAESGKYYEYGNLLKLAW